MLRLNVKSVGEHQCLTVATMLNNHNLVLTGSRFLSDKSWSFLVVDGQRPFDFSPGAIRSVRERVDPLVTILSAEVQPYLEDCDGVIYCAKCAVVADYLEERDSYHCTQCGDRLSVQGGGTHGRR